MKKSTLTSLLLTGAVLICSQSVYASPDEHNTDVQEIIQRIESNLEKLKEIHAATAVGAEASGTRDNVVSLNEREEVEEKPLVPAEEEPKADEPVTPENRAEPQQSKMQSIIKKYMEAREDKALAADMEKEIKGEFAINHKNACFETVKYVQGKSNPINKMKLGTLLNIMQIPNVYYKTVDDTLKGIRSGIQMREKDARGTYFNKKVIFTAEMLCAK